MITCNLMGGLGNQIFQIFTVIAYSIKSRNLDIKFTSAQSLGGGGTIVRRTYWDDFFSKLKTFTTDVFPQMEVISEKGFNFNDIPINELKNKNVMLYGYFQSYKYFQDKYHFICDMIGLEDMKQKLMSKIGLNESYFNNTISMHFRLGDYKNKQEYHPIMTYEYYYNSLSHIQKRNPSKKWNIMYFCEDEDVELVEEKINNLKSVFPEYTFSRCDASLDDWEQMLLMSLCCHNIIANSSFSWWGAYFNSNIDKVVCYPSVWFGFAMNVNAVDLCPPNWNKINL